MQQSISTESNSLALPAFFCIRQDPDNEANVESVSPVWYNKLPYKKVYPQKFHTTCELDKPTELYKNLFLFFLHRFIECDYTLEWPQKIKYHFNDWLSKNDVVSSIETTAEAENIAELISKTAKKRKMLSFSQAKSLALTALADADKRRQEFAEQEAKIVSVWEAK